MKKIILLLICFFLASHKDSVYAQTCLDQQIPLSPSTIEYAALNFTQCMQKNQCAAGKAQLEKMKQQDPVAHAFVSGVAYANGDCVEQSVKKAESKLKYCAKYSRTCRSELLMLYGLFVKDKSQYENYALGMAEDGSLNAMAFLAQYYAEQRTSVGYGMSLYWAEIMAIGAENKLTEFTSNPDFQQMYQSTLQFRNDLQKDIEQLRTVIQPKAAEIKRMAQKFVDTHPPRQQEDPLGFMGDIYAVVGQPLNPRKTRSSLTLTKANPPREVTPSLDLEYDLKLLATLMS